MATKIEIRSFFGVSAVKRIVDNMNQYRLAETETIHTSGKDFLYLVEDKAIFEMEPSAAAALAALRKNNAQPLTRMQIQSCLSKIPSEDCEIDFQDLVARRILLPENHPASPNFSDIESYNSIPLKTFILHLTDACNLRCRYCYHAEWPDQPSAKKAMDERTALGAVDFLLAHSGNLENVVIVFFGGEPLLNFKLIPIVASYAKQKASEQKKRIDFAITTNGTLLEDNIIDELQQHDIGITVSLDGFDNNDSRYRCFPDGSASYDVLLPKLKKLLDRHQNRPAVARITLVENPERVPQILNYLLELGFAEVGFAPVTTGHSDYQLGIKEMNQLLDAFQSLTARFLQSARKGEFLGFTNLIDLLVSLHQGDVMDYPCGAGLGLFAVDPEGGLFLCQRFTGNESFRMGDIHQGFDQRKLTDFRGDAAISNKADCRQCWARAICTGGCYHEACIREGSHLQPNLHYCDWVKRWSKIGMNAYCQLASEFPDFMDKLCLSRGYKS